MSFLLPILHAQTDKSPELLLKFYNIIVQPVIMLLFALAVVYFIYGVYEFIRESDAPDGREKGKQTIIWGIIGMLIMASAFGIVNLIVGTLSKTGSVSTPDSINRIR